MTYQVLARKWRPRDFQSLIGQDHVVRALTHALQHQRLHHAYLFTGTRGVGKTTIARILAKALNCVGPDGQGGITATPCNACRVCSAIDAGRFVDYIEMDAASNRGVDEMTQLLERAIYAPVDARVKVYTIDEVHMLTTHAFNAMLKTLEEPPDFVKFILATTDPQKIPVTVLSRCLQFNLKQVTPQAIAQRLGQIAQAEQVEAEPAALQAVARAARGSMRDALSLLDQAIAYSGGRVDAQAVDQMLGSIDSTLLVAAARRAARARRGPSAGAGRCDGRAKPVVCAGIARPRQSAAPDRAGPADRRRRAGRPDGLPTSGAWRSGSRPTRCSCTTRSRCMGATTWAWRRTNTRDSR